jgi:adenylate cyclase
MSDSATFMTISEGKASRSSSPLPSQSIFKYILSLRVKTIGVLLCLFTILIGAFALVVFLVFTRNFSKLEKRDTSDASWRLMRAIYDDFQNQLRVNLPISAWDLTYSVMVDYNKTNADVFKEENLYPQLLDELNVDLALFYWPNGTLVLYSCHENQEPIDVPEPLLSIPPDHPFLRDMDKSESTFGGWLQYNGSTYSLVGTPVQPGAMTGETCGVFITGRKEIPENLLVYATKTQQCVTSIPIESGSMSKEAESLWSLGGSTDPVIVDVRSPIWKNNKPFLIEPLKKGSSFESRVCWDVDGESSLKSDRIAAYVGMADIYDVPIMFWRTDIPRNVQTLASKSLGWAFGMLGLIGVLVSIAIIILMEWTVVFPTLKMTKDIKAIAKNNDVSLRVSVSSKDEIGNMGRQINSMLAALEASQKELEREKRKSEKLLLNMLPEVISRRLKGSGNTRIDPVKLESNIPSFEVHEQESILVADTFPEVSVLFSDMVGFTVLSSKIESTALVRILNTIFSVFDKLCMKNGVEKIKTIGDAFMAVAGAPVPVPDHADRAVNQAKDMLRSLQKVNSRLGCDIQIRIGVNSGAVVAGVIGTTKYVYDIFGDTVTIASKMESTGVPGCLHISEMTYNILQSREGFEPKGTCNIVGREEQITTYLFKPNL